MNALDQATLAWVNAPTARERGDAIIRIAQVQRDRLAESLRLEAAEYRERWQPGSEVGGPCPDEWEPEDHEPPDAPLARPGSLRQWVGEI